MSPTPLRLLLVDDEAPARKEMQRLLRAHAEVCVIGEADDLASAAELANRETPDAIFLDVQLANATGFDLLPLLTCSPQIVFVTAYDHYALGAFEANALDYLLKPVHPQRLALTVQRLLQPRVEEQPRSASSNLILLRDRDRMRIARPGDIVVIRAEGTYCHLELSDGDRFYLHRSIRQWELLLPPEQFTRLDRSLLINLQYVCEVRPIDRNTAEVLFTDSLPPLQIGRTALGNLRSALRAVRPPQP